MAYQIDRFNNTILTSVEDGTVDRTTDLKFIGKNYAGYGEIQNENFLYLLENFSSPSQPPRPISGQVWYDSSNNKLKFYDGTKFKTTGGAEISPTQPVGLTEGDFWWNSSNQQLYAFNGTDFTLIGPQSTAGAGVTQMQSDTVIDSEDNNRVIIKGTIDDNVVFIVSNSEFVLGSTSAITGFSTIKKGLNLANTNADGVSGSDYVYWGTASNAQKLNGVDASEYVLASSSSFTDTDNAVSFEDIGLTIGDGGSISVESQNQLTIQNTTGNLIKFKARNNSGQVIHSVSVTPEGIVPAATSTFDLGSNTYKWRTVYADSFDGVATVAERIRLSTVDYQPSLGAVNNTVALRDSSGDITANEFSGVASSAKFADLAEIYQTDTEYPVGTVVAVGGKNEVRAARVTDFAIGVISDKPAYLMNSEADGQAVGLKGRVPVRVKGPVSKGQPLYAFDGGVATTITSASLIGIALESNNDANEKLIECVLKV